MILGGVIAIFFGVAAEGKALEDVATPLSVIAKPPEAAFRSGADRSGIDPLAPGSGTAGMAGTVGSTGTGSGSVPDPRLGAHDDPARTHRGDDI
jgi:hypothetical protein